MFWSIEAEERLDRVAGLVAARDRLDAELAAAVADADSTGAWGACPHRGAKRFLRHQVGQSPEVVRTLLARARLIRRFAATAAALAGGSVGLGAVDALTCVVTRAREARYERDEVLLLGHAARLAVEDFEVLLAHWAGLVDDEADPGRGGEWRQHLAVQRRFDGGADLFGALDEFTAQTLLAALDAFDPGPDPLADPGRRSIRERHADALGDMAAAAMGAGTDDPGRQVESRPESGSANEQASEDATSPTGPAAHRVRRPPVSDTTVVVDVRTLQGRSGPMDLEGLISEINGRTVSGRAVAALLCDSWVSALVRDARGAVIDATERSAPFTPTQRRLLAARDRGCVIPGCARPPSHCDAHHLLSRHSGGPNTLENAALLCRRHHRLVHHGWTLSRGPDHRWTITSPTGRTWTDPPTESDTG